MARTKKDAGSSARNGRTGRTGTTARGRTGTATPARPAGELGAFQKELRAVREQALRETRDGYQQLGRELTATAGRLAESIRHAQEQLTDIVRQAREARRDVEELRQFARDAHREQIGEPAGRDRAGAAAGGHGAGVPARTAKSRGGRRAAGGRAEADARNRLGVTVGSGVVVAEVWRDSPAGAAGLKKGDVIEDVNGIAIVSAAHLRDAVRHAADNAEVTLRIVRAGEPEEVKAKVGKAGNDNAGEGRNRLGVTVGPGVVVAEVLPDTPASKAGLERGDVIEDVNGTAVLSGEQLRDVVQKLPVGTNAILRVTRAGKVKTVTAKVDGAPVGG